MGEVLRRHRVAIAAAVFMAAAAWLLWSEHRPHFLGALPFLVLLACPLMHLFMHGGHGNHGGEGGHGGHEGHGRGRGEGRGKRR
jgi:hypothetical protein